MGEISGCPRCGAGNTDECRIGEPATIAELTDSTQVRERFGPWPQTGTVKVGKDGVRVVWDELESGGFKGDYYVVDRSADKTGAAEFPVSHLELAR